MPTSRAIHLPADEGPHRERFEWWYWNFNLTDTHGKSYAAMTALFKGRPIGFPDLWSLHSVVASASTQRSHVEFTFYHKMDVSEWLADRFCIGVNDAFQLARVGNVYDVVTPEMRLRMTPLKPPIFVGGSGFVDLKSSTTHYYTLPRLRADGEILVGKTWIPVTGTAWMDHQWQKITVSRENKWEWFSAHLSDGTDLQWFRFGEKKKVEMATISHPDGTQSVSKHLRLTPTSDRWTSPKTGLTYALAWHVEIPEAGINLQVSPRIPSCEMVFGPVIYWEGPLRVTGKVGGASVTGDGFFENVPTTDVGTIARALAKYVLTRAG